VSEFTKQIQRQFAKKADKPSKGLKDVKFYRFPSVVSHPDGQRELVWTVKAMPAGTRDRDQARAEIVNSHNATVAWKDSAGTPKRIGPEPLSDAEVVEFLALTKEVTDGRNREKEAAKIAGAPRAVILTAPDGTSQVVSGGKGEAKVKTKAE